MSRFYNRLSYSFGNEGWETEQQALRITPEDRVLSVTASGDRPLHLAMKECREIVTIDANPAQDHLFTLKKTAMAHADPEKYLEFMGVTPCCNRKEIFRQIAKDMPAETVDFWKSHEHLIEKGIIYQGATEKWYLRASLLLRWFRKNEIRGLFECKSIEEQQKYLKNHWNHTLWRTAFKSVVNKPITKILLQDPGLYAYLDANIHPGAYIYDRIIRQFNNELARNNPFLSLLFQGKVEREAFSPHLQVQGINQIKPQLNRIHSKVGNVIHYLESVPENSFDAFSLSDIASYMDHQSFLRLLKAMYLAAKPGARFCIRQFMSRYKIPEGLKPYFQRDQALEESLGLQDQGFIYEFTVGKVLKD